MIISKFKQFGSNLKVARAMAYDCVKQLLLGHARDSRFRVPCVPTTILMTGWSFLLKSCCMKHLFTWLGEEWVLNESCHQFPWEGNLPSSDLTSTAKLLSYFDDSDQRLRTKCFVWAWTLHGKVAHWKDIEQTCASHDCVDRHIHR